MFENMMNFFKKIMKKDKSKESSDTAKERLHLVLMQDRANVSADFLELMKQEIIEVIKKYVDVDDKEIDVHLTNKANDDGTVGAPALYANIPIVTIKNEARKLNTTHTQNNEKKSETKKKEKSEVEDKDKNKEIKKEEESKEEVEIKEEGNKVEIKEEIIEDNKEIKEEISASEEKNDDANEGEENSKEEQESIDEEEKE